ncbi:hypothetical protein L202_08025 [Cryptococcus amylolentus CBS 6039]|uniref:Enoyl reductase (ER) domain-containing protein n=2 Tax=Cryptococcus amylolentus TaxID=104669 RepID=A0A1E3HB39_9TREE|nr:hypothetical protein L202_08025 [Cryptococcus amylolentus CBS 6039]ODN73524.1 hypothetical protein L202_08025 [Cryptococcus amylolentus CBS 6039]ODN99267.1 hypothetical protein I350_07427 [Cryptococcus amylolentus CBS 6273]
MSATAIPETMKAWSDWVSIAEIPVPKPGPNQVLVNVLYAAQNPTDWKHALFLSAPGTTSGCDFSGIIVALGPDLASPHTLAPGTRVASTLRGGYYRDQGAFAEYTLVESDLLWVVPNEVKLEDAVTFGIGWTTAAQVLVQRQGKAFPSTGDTKVTNNPWYIIYGGSTSVGLFAIQFAKILGYRVLALASPHSFPLLKSYGADAVLDYHDPDAAIAQGLEITRGEGAEFGLDTIGEGDSVRITVGIMGSKGRQLNAFPGVLEDDVRALNAGLKLDTTIVYTLSGKPFDIFARTPGKHYIPAIPQDRAFGVQIFQQTAELITKYGIKANPVQITGGFEDVGKGLELLKNNQISGKKSVIRIANEA